MSNPQGINQYTKSGSVASRPKFKPVNHKSGLKDKTNMTLFNSVLNRSKSPQTRSKIAVGIKNARNTERAFKRSVKNITNAW